MNTKITTGSIILALMLGIWSVATPNKTYIQQNGGEPVQLRGAASSDLSTNWFSFGGVRMWAARDTSMTSATTTICALRGPAATSTLLRASVMLSVSSTTASTVTIAKASTPYATTTLLGSGAVAANAQVTLMASSTLSNASTIFAPNDYVVVGMQGGSAGTFSPTGVCNAVWVNAD